MTKRLPSSLSRLDIDQDALDRLPKPERDRAIRELLALEEEFKRNPLLGYVPHAKQVVFHSPPFPSHRLFCGGNRSGKTTAVVVDSIIQAVDQEFVPAHLKPFKRWEPPFHCRFISPDLGNTLYGVLLEKIRKYTPADQLRGGSFDRAWDKQLRLLSFKNGGWMQFMSGDQDRDKMGGTALHRVVFDEEPPKSIRDECLWRLVDYEGEEMFAMTPFSGMSWIYDDFYEPWERGQLDEDSRVVVVDIDENPHLTEKGKAMALAGATAEEREARKSGRFVHFAGLIYPEFDKNRHVLPTPQKDRVIPPGSEVFCGIDPGWRHMAAVVYCYLDLEDRLVVFDEIALQRSTVREVCVEIKKRNMFWGVSPRWYVIDPASRNKSGQTGISDQREFQEHGVYTTLGQNSVTAGINRVKERLQADKLLVMAHCNELRGQFKRYRWVSNSRSENDAKEEPVKKDDHLLDALRYVCMQRPLPPPEERRLLTMTMKDRLLRADLARLSRRKPIDHPSGAGFFS